MVAKLAELDGTAASSAALWGDEGPQVERLKGFYGQQVDCKRWVWRELGRCTECGGSVIGTRAQLGCSTARSHPRRRVPGFSVRDCDTRGLVVGASSPIVITLVERTIRSAAVDASR